jgi:hypothetical protein
MGVGDHSGDGVKVGLGVFVGGTEVTSGLPAAHPALIRTASARTAIKNVYLECTFRIQKMRINTSPDW